MSALPETAEAPAPLAVRLTGISKAYPLSGPSGKLLWLPWTKRPEPSPDFFALKDINLEIPAGRSLGILGLNGAGKSTLLSLVAGNIRPTSGQLEVNGHVQLLQLGAGFTPELTARQNVVAHTRARGLSKEEIERRVAYVQEFADIGPFFDQPMQNYSSGMRGRVAFGNAFAIDPEILIVDEALAVGDAVFVNKCFRKIEDVRSKGTTILFVSHSSDAVVRLCDDGIVLHKGELVASGTARSAAEAYSKIVMGGGARGSTDTIDNNTALSLETDVAADAPLDRPERGPETFAFESADDVDRTRKHELYNHHESVVGSGGATIVDCAVRINGKEVDSGLFQQGDELEINFRIYFDRAVSNANFGFTLNDSKGVIFYGTNQLWSKQALPDIAAGTSHLYRIRFPLKIAAGDWFLSPAISESMTVLQQRRSMLHFNVQPLDVMQSGSGWLDLEFGSVDSPVE